MEKLIADNKKNINIFENDDPILIFIASLSLGGAEKIVIDWATSESLRGRKVELAVLHSVNYEFHVPKSILLLRRKKITSISSFLTALCDRWKIFDTPISTHLIKDNILNFILNKGLFVVPVIHNDINGWKNDPLFFNDKKIQNIVACADFVEEKMRTNGYKNNINVIKHKPKINYNLVTNLNKRLEVREKFKVESDCLLVGCIGSIKHQKNYLKAIDILFELNKIRKAKLVIFGGVINEDSHKILNDIYNLSKKYKLDDNLILTGFVDDIENYFPAIDVLLNCSLFEGFPIGIQEALISGIPAVVSDISGNNEIKDKKIFFVKSSDSNETFAKKISSLPIRTDLIFNKSIDISRIWSLSTAISNNPTENIENLFVTSNLNAGGAQRSLVNLTKKMNNENFNNFEIAVCNPHSNSYFSDDLINSNINIFQLSKSRDVFDLTRSLLINISKKQVKNVLFWNLDPKIKLLLSMFAKKDLKIIDVSPGGYAFEELDATLEFQNSINYSSDDFYNRLNHLVLKYDAPKNEIPKILQKKYSVINNGVVFVDNINQKNSDTIKFLVSGRITPSKHSLSIIKAYKEFFKVHKNSEIHFYGQSEERDSNYLNEVIAISEDLPVFFHGSNPELTYLKDHYDANIVLGSNQGCPNTVLEAFSSNKFVIANNSGGTSELVKNNKTGIMISENFSQDELINALLYFKNLSLNDKNEMILNANNLISENFSMNKMFINYKNMLNQI